uniref:Transcription initiation factor TFIID subunit 12 n=1 Tax=Panagrolaimus sp. JU765 TaxID=591449 RepID=A0AC34Q5N8_9BILA
MQQHAMQHKMPDGSMMQGGHQQHMMMQSTPRPVQRMMVNSQQSHQMNMQQQAMANMHLQQQHKMRMGNQQQQQGMPSQQGYYVTRPMAQPPIKVAQQIQMQQRNDGMRPQQTPPGQTIIVRNNLDAMQQLSQQGSVIIQQQSSQAQHISQPGNAQYIRANFAQPNQIRAVRSSSQLIRTPEGVFRQIRPEGGQTQYIVRQQAPQVAYTVASSSGEQQTYQIVHQSVGQQPSYIQQSVRVMRPPQQQQSHLQMALARPATHVQTSQAGQAPLVVIQQGSSSNVGHDVKPMIVDQTGAELRVGTSTSTLAAVRPLQQIHPGTPVRQVVVPKPIQAPFVSNPVVQVRAPAAKLAPRPPIKKTKAKAKPGEKPPTPLRKMADTSDTMGNATAKSKLISNPNFDRLLASLGVKDSIDSNAKNALCEFAEFYADDLISQLVAAAKHRKVNKIENKDANFVIDQQLRRDPLTEYKKR